MKAETPLCARAAVRALAASKIRELYNEGIGRAEALAFYLSTLHRPTDAGRIAVTSAGVNALMLASQLIVDPGERVVEVVPLWPNLQEIPKILNARVATVALEF